MLLYYGELFFFIKWLERFSNFSVSQLHWPLKAAAAAVWAAPLESAASRLSAGRVVAVVSLITVLATPIITHLILVLVTAAASAAKGTAAATSSVVVFEMAVVAVALAAYLLLSVLEFLPLGGASLSGSVSGSRTENHSQIRIRIPAGGPPSLCAVSYRQMCRELSSRPQSSGSCCSPVCSMRGDWRVPGPGTSCSSPPPPWSPCSCCPVQLGPPECPQL